MEVHKLELSNLNYISANLTANWKIRSLTKSDNKIINSHGNWVTRVFLSNFDLSTTKYLLKNWFESLFLL